MVHGCPKVGNTSLPACHKTYRKRLSQKPKDECDKPKLTMRIEFFKPEKRRYLHPQADRAHTHREGA